MCHHTQLCNSTSVCWSEQRRAEFPVVIDFAVVHSTVSTWVVQADVPFVAAGLDSACLLACHLTWLVLYLEEPTKLATWSPSNSAWNSGRLFRGRYSRWSAKMRHGGYGALGYGGRMLLEVLWRTPVLVHFRETLLRELHTACLDSIHPSALPRSPLFPSSTSCFLFKKKRTSHSRCPVAVFWLLRVFFFLCVYFNASVSIFFFLLKGT